jgi:hypothetical protein
MLAESLRHLIDGMGLYDATAANSAWCSGSQSPHANTEAANVNAVTSNNLASLLSM